MTDNPYKNEDEDAKAAIEMDEIARTLFAPIYPLVASHIKEKFNITTGQCIDLGSGSAALSIALARRTDLKIYALDASKHSFRFAEKNIKEEGFDAQITPITARAESLPFEDNTADLIISRGSIFFWDDLKTAFNEIFRVLKPGGQTYIGGGFGSTELKKNIFEEMAKKGDGFAKKSKARFSPENMERIKNDLDQSEIQDYEIYKGDKGFWIHITKES